MGCCADATNSGPPPSDLQDQTNQIRFDSIATSLMSEAEIVIDEKEIIPKS